jgi:Spy/CpxP family protein refolding chaperone
VRIVNNILLGLLILGMFALPAVYAQDEASARPQRERLKEAWHEKMEKNVQEIYSQLNLTEEQKKLLEENKVNNQNKRKAVFQAMRANKEELNQELMKQELDMAKVNEIQAKLKQSQSQMTDDHLNSILEIRKILTPEQFAKFITLMDKARERRQEGEKDDKR